MKMDPIQFEKVAAHLLHATHNVRLPCQYNGSIIRRQFDGYRVVWYGVFSHYKIGIECRKRSRKVGINSVEEFAKKIEKCKIDKGIMVSFLGFTSNAIIAAKSDSLDLYSLRQCRPDDVAENIRQIDFIEFTDHFARANIAIPADDLSFEDAQAIDASSMIDRNVYDEKGVRLGTLEDIARSMVEFEVLTGGRKLGVLEKDLSETSAYLHIMSRGKKQKILVKSISVRYRTRIASKLADFQSSEHYIMKNELTLERRLIPVSKVNEIIRKYTG